MPPALIRVLLTMDCERVKDGAQLYPAGPLSWGESEQNISAFAEIASEFGFRATFFAVPEAIEAHEGTFKRLIAGGHEVGLHLHPSTFRYGVNEYLGNLPREIQRSIICEARDAFQAAMGFAPTSFRPGHFSANGETFEVLAALGFKRGSAVVPGRHHPGTGGDWRGWNAGCQYVGGIFEAPVTVHQMSSGAFLVHSARHVLALASRGCFADSLRGGLRMFRGTSFVDLRLEEGSYGLIREIVRAEALRLDGHKGLAALNALTHSYVNFSGQDRRGRDHGMSRRGHLRRLLGDLSGWPGLTFQSRTLTELHAEFDSTPSWAA